MSQNPIKELANLPRSRFEWWVQQKFNVLPTDPRYQDLTEEQFDLIYEHYQLDNPKSHNPAYTDEDYEKEEAKNEGYDGSKAKEEGRLPLADQESFNDPDFDEEWNAEDGEEDMNNLDENSPDNDFESLVEGANSDMEFDNGSHSDDDWEEV